jgi:uncharacterized protein
MNSDAIRTLVLAGGSGFLGSALADYFSNRGWKIVILTRQPSSSGAFQQVEWDGKNLGDWTKALDDSAAVINLVGRSINCRFTPENRKEILESRVDATRVLGQAIAKCQKPPAVWLNCSGVGIYNQSFDTDIDESDSNFSEAETDASFTGKVALLWERALAEGKTPRTRKVALRISMVLGRREGTAFAILQRLTRLGLAGTMGSGNQFVSWIHVRDLCRSLESIIQSPNLDGPINITAPEPVTNAQFMRTLRRACGRSFGLPAPAFALKLGSIFTGTEADLILDSRRVVPGRLLASGFKFNFPTCASALQDLTVAKDISS